MKENPSPEEKLLRLIRNPKKQAEVPTQAVASLVASQPPAAKPRRALSGRRYFFLTNFPTLIKGALVFSFLFLALNFVWPFIGLKKLTLPEVSAPKTGQVLQEIKTQGKPYEFYRSGTQGRRLFGSQTGADDRPVNPVNADLIKDINLVGIITGDNPQAVIEDKKSQKTYYVVKGQAIGELQIEEILEGKIIIGYRGQRFELYL